MLKLITDYIAEQVKERPDQAAVIFNHEPMTFAELDKKSNQIANGILSLGVKPSSRVAILNTNSLEFCPIILGAVKAQTVLVSIHFRQSPAELTYVLRDAEVEILMVGAAYYETAMQIAAELPKLRYIIALDGNGPKQMLDYPNWVNEFTFDDPALRILPDNDLLQLYTSGTTGHPKGVCHTHENYSHFLSDLSKTWCHFIAGKDVTLTCMPLCHVAGINNLLYGVSQGVTVVIANSPDPIEILELIPRYKIVKTLFAPAIIQGILNHPKAAETDFSSLQEIHYGAAPMSPSVLAEAVKLFGCAFVQLYGMTENLGAATWLPWEDHAPERGKQGSCGKAYNNVTLGIMDDNDQLLPTGGVGEIVMKAPWIMRCYWQRQKATSEAIKGGWLHTGDVGYLDDEGYLYIQDRLKDMIISGGENIYPAEIENALYEHPDILEVAAFGVPDTKWGEAVHATIVMREGADCISDEDLNAFARERIAGFKIPKSYNFIDSLPRNLSGKVLRRDLRAPYWRETSRQVN